MIPPLPETYGRSRLTATQWDSVDKLIAWTTAANRRRTDKPTRLWLFRLLVTIGWAQFTAWRIAIAIALLAIGWFGGTWVGQL